MARRVEGVGLAIVVIAVTVVCVFAALGLLDRVPARAASSWAATPAPRQGHTAAWFVGGAAGLALLFGAGLAVYDALHRRIVEAAHERLELAERDQGLALAGARVFLPDAHGRQGIAYDGHGFRDLDSKAAYTMGQNLYLNPILESLNAQQKLMTAMYGMMVRAGDVAQLVANNEPAAPAVQWPTRVPLRGLLDGPPSFHSMALGVTMRDDGTPEVVRADMAQLVHVAVGGSSGWGKSVFLRALAYQLAKSSDPVGLAMIDLEGATLAPFATCERLLWPLADNERDAGAILRELTAELDRRKALFAAYPGADSLSAYNAQARDPLTPIVAIVDEATALLENREIEKTLRVVALRARKFGVWLLLAGQDWKGTTLDSAIRNQLSTRVQFRAMSASQSRVLLQQAGAEDLEVKGRALAWLPGRELIALQAPIVSSEEIAAAVSGGGPRGELASQERDAATVDAREQRMLALAAQGLKPTPIAREVFGYVNSDVVARVRDVIENDDDDGDAQGDAEDLEAGIGSSSSQKGAGNGQVCGTL